MYILFLFIVMWKWILSCRKAEQVCKALKGGKIFFDRKANIIVKQINNKNQNGIIKPDGIAQG